MAPGTLEEIYLGTVHGAELVAYDEATVIVGVGLVGDRYGDTPSKPRKPDPPGFEGEREVTLIEAESFEAVSRDEGITLKPAQSRRNLLVRGVALNHLVGRRFRVGAVVLEGVRLCEPCKHLESMTCKGVREAFLHRGGLRARVVVGGVIRRGDSVRSDSVGDP